ncbi:MAG TPA: hypothetical protein VJ770_24215 [Stellaceae bacterium]|nr:hypothetical protein [Stellaceae bacterium]
MKPELARCLVVLSGLLATSAAAGLSAAGAASSRTLYAVNESRGDRGSISVYDIDAGHRLIKTTRTVPRVGDVRGVTASAVTGRLYVAYRDISGAGMVYCLDLYGDKVVWNKAVSPGVDRLAIDPDGKWLYVPTGEYDPANFLNVVDAAAGDVVRRVYFSKRLHDTQYPLSGPVFQTTKAGDGSGRYLYRIDPKSYAVSRIGPYGGILGPYAVDGASRHVVNNVTGLWGMQVADLTRDTIVTATIPDHPPGSAGLLHGIGWTPDQSEVWEDGGDNDPHVYVWDMRQPMAPVLKTRLTLSNGHGAHWLTFTIRGDYGYIAPGKNSSDKTEIFAVRTHSPVGAIAASEDMLEIDFADGKISQVGDQYGIGRRR